MQRKVDTDLLTWKKTGGGSFRLSKGRIIKPGQIFKARLDEIPNAFRDIVILQDQPEVTAKAVAKKVEKKEPVKTAEKKLVEKVAPKKEVKSSFLIEPTGAKADKLFNVVDGDGKPINEDPLDEDAAVALIEKLNTP